jgi:hypothetical protein
MYEWWDFCSGLWTKGARDNLAAPIWGYHGWQTEFLSGQNPSILSRD